MHSCRRLSQSEITLSTQPIAAANQMKKLLISLSDRKTDHRSLQRSTMIPFGSRTLTMATVLANITTGLKTPYDLYIFPFFKLFSQKAHDSPVHGQSLTEIPNGRIEMNPASAHFRLDLATEPERKDSADEKYRNCERCVVETISQSFHCSQLRTPLAARRNIYMHSN